MTSLALGLKLSAIKTLSAVQRAINILKSAGPGAWYDPSDLTTLYQDSAGTTPVTAVEQPVGLILDKSRGLVLGSELVTNGDFSSATGWTVGVGWSISGGVATKVAGTGDNLYKALFPPGQSCAGKYLSITLTATVTAGSLLVSPGGYQTAPAITASGTYTFKVLAWTPSSERLLYLIADAAFAGTIDNISAKEVLGNHAIQPTATSRPTLSSRYNLLTKTEQFDDVYWAKGSTSVTANSATAPDGTNTADSLVEAAATAATYIGRIAAGLPVTADTFVFSLYVKANGRNQVGLSLYGGGVNNYITAVYDLSAGTVSKTQAGSSGTITSTSITASGSGWYRIVMSGNTAAPAQIQAYVYPTNSTTPTIDQYGTPLAYTGDGTSGLFIWGAQLVVASDSSRPYQRVNTATDYDFDFSKFPPFLRFDGVDDSMYTSASIDFNSLPADGQTKRNLLSASEAFDDAVWTKLNVTATAGKVSETAVTGVFIAYQSVMPGAGTYTFTVEAKAAERSRIALEYASSTPFAVFDLSTGVVQSFGSSTATITSLGDGWYRCTMTATLAAGSTSAVGVRDNAGNRSYAGSAGSGVLVRGAQLEAGSTATAYQKTGTDKMTVFAGVHKASDGASAMLAELSADAGATNGAFYMIAPANSGVANAGFASRGTIAVGATATGIASPTTKVFTGVSNVAGDSVILRSNGVQVANATGDQGTGNYGNYPLYVGRRNNASLPFSGRLYQLALKGKALSAAEISTVESFINSRTKAFV